MKASRWAVETAGGRRLRLYDGTEGTWLCIGFVAPDDWHTTFPNEADAAAVAAKLNADNPRRGARVVPI